MMEGSAIKHHTCHLNSTSSRIQTLDLLTLTTWPSLKTHTDNPLYIDTPYQDKICYNDNLTVMKLHLRGNN